MGVSIDAVSVVIPHYGEAGPTLALIEQLRGQRVAARVQIVVSDDCSADVFPHGDGYEVVRRGQNGGFGAAVNSGIERATHDAVLVLNSDVEIEPTFLDELLAGAAPWWPAVVAPRVMHPYGDAIVARRWPTVPQQMAEWCEPLARFHGRDWLERSIGNDVDAHRSADPVLTDWVLGVCTLLPTADVRAVGGFDERYFMNCEEIDLQRRLHDERALPVVLLPAPMLQHASGASSDPDRRAGWLTDARFRYHQKWNGGAALRLGLTSVALVNLAWGSVRSLLGRGNQPLETFTQQRAWIEHGWATRRGWEVSSDR